MGTLGTAFWVETGAALLGIWGVWDLSGGRRRGYISGVLSTSAYVVLCAIHGIYADAVINGWYTVMGFVGWFAWGQRKTENGGVPLRSMDAQGFSFLFKNIYNDTFGFCCVFIQTARWLSGMPRRRPWRLQPCYGWPPGTPGIGLCG